jgi:adenylyltransferase/sulfurtransferase
LVVGAGGIGNPAALVLAAHGGVSLLVIDDDHVELSNLHRQCLFDDRDVGRPKLDALRDALVARFPSAQIDTRTTRLTPDVALSLVREVDVVLDGTDNFASRFLAADACAIAGVAVVHAASVRWRGTVVVSGAAGRAPCYRCLFEDLPEGPAPDCASAGVVGPVCGIVGAIAADACNRILEGDPTIYATRTSIDGRDGTIAQGAWLRRQPLSRRVSCALCGVDASISTVDAARYVGPHCDL